MPDMRITTPLVETHDQRGASFNMGVGNANTSELGAFMEGFQSSAVNMANFRQTQVETAIMSDPQKLAAEQLQRDLTNIRLNEMIKEAQINNATLPELNQLEVKQKGANITSTIASTENTRARTAGQYISNSSASHELALDRKYGETQRQTEIEAKREHIRQARAQADSAELENSLDQTFSALEREQGIAAKDAASETSDILREQRIRDRAIKDNNQRIKAREDALKTKKTSAERKPIEQELNNLRARGVLLSDPNDLDDNEPRTTTDILAAESAQAEKTIQERAAEANARLAKAKTTQELSKVTKQNEAIQTQDARYQIANLNAARIKESVNDTDGSGNFNMASALPPLFSLAEIQKQAVDPDEKENVTSFISQGLKDLGGAKQVLQYIENNVANPDQKNGLKKAVYNAVVQSGELEALAPEQRDLLGMGLGAEDLADPEKVRQDMSSLLAGKGSVVENDRLKNLRSDPYYIRARMASKDNTQSFTIKPTVIPSTQGGADIAGQDAQSQGVLEFRGADGSAFYGPLPETDQQKAMFNFLERIASDTTVQVNESKRAQNTAKSIQQSRQEANKPASVKTPAAENVVTEKKPLPDSKTTPARQITQEQFQAAVRSNTDRAIALREEKEGRQLTLEEKKAAERLVTKKMKEQLR